MKGHSKRDRAFMRAFAEKLRRAREKAKDEGNISYEEFARRLGVTRAGIHKYFNQENVPSLDILERAKALGVEVKYGDLDSSFIKKRAKDDHTSSEAQMLLPLALDALTDQDISVELAGKKQNAIELNVTITFVRRKG